MVSSLSKKLWADLIALKGQVISIALVVSTGIAVIIGALSCYDSLRWAQQYFYQHYQFANLFVSLKHAPNTLMTQMAKIPGIKQVQLEINKEVKIDIKNMKEPAIGLFISLSKNRQKSINRPHLRQGRWPSPSQNKELLISESFAKEHRLRPGDSISAILNGRHQQFIITGIAISPQFIYSIRAQDIIPDNKHFGVFWLNAKAMESAFNMVGAFNQLSIVLSNHANPKPIIAALDVLLVDYGSLGAYTRKNQISHRFLTNEFEQLKFMATVLPTIFLIITSFLVNMVISRLVTLQRTQIASLKALGYSNRNIVLYYFKFVLVIITIGAVIGISFGVWMGQSMIGLYREYFIFPLFPFKLSPLIPLVSIIISLIAAIIGMLNSLHRVFKLSPSQAMRPQSPKLYTRSAIDYLLINSKVSPVVKIIIRNLSRSKLRQASSIMGISCGIGIVILGLFWGDAFNYLIDAQFRHAERGHIMVNFNDVVNRQSIVELQKIPGVLSVEGMRTIPVRFQSQQHDYQTGLIGFVEKSSQRQLLNDKLEKINLIPNQFFLSLALAQVLNVKVGDSLWIEALSGKKKKRLVTVNAIVDDFIGLSGYMEYESLHHLFDESFAVTSASMLIDKNKEHTIYQRLKTIPKIATVTIKYALIKTFEDTFAKHILIFTGFLSVFAIIIAVGIIYNNAQIALSERALELATMRVIGMTQKEVAIILIGELLIQLIIAIPIGVIIALILATISINLIPADIIRIPLVIQSHTYIIASTIAMCAALFSAIIVFKRIKKLDLLAVLKTMD
jgi:putative ABC transport system permease protein